MEKFELKKEVGEHYKDFIEVTINDKDRPSVSELTKTFDFNNKRFEAKLTVQEVEKHDEIF